MLHLGLLLPHGGVVMRSDFGTTMPVKSREESIPSLQRTALRAAAEPAVRRLISE
jgi:hypothetical protein